MATQTRIYRVTVGENDRLIRATHPSHALMFVARDLAVVKVASQEDLVECLGDDIQIETIKQEQTELPDS